MKTASTFLAAAGLAIGAAAIPANAAPITLPSSLQSAVTSPLENVQFRRWGGWRAWGPGLAAGAVIGGAIAATTYGYNNYYDDYAYVPGYSYSYAPAYSYSYGSGPSGYNSYNYNYAPSGYSYSYGSSGYDSYAYAPGYRSRYNVDYGTTPGYNYSPSGYNSRYYAPGGSSGYSAGYAAGDSAAYCKQRFRSYDPASGTYLGYDGQRHPCP
jgi:BA14K-like protein